MSVEPREQVRLAENEPSAIVVLAATWQHGCVHVPPTAVNAPIDTNDLSFIEPPVKR